MHSSSAVLHIISCWILPDQLTFNSQGSESIPKCTYTKQYCIFFRWQKAINESDKRVNGERSALDKDTLDLKCDGLQHSILSKIENIFFFFLDLTGKELVSVYLGFVLGFFFLVRWIEVQFLYSSILNTKFDFLASITSLTTVAFSCIHRNSWFLKESKSLPFSKI